jgi:hypothetical protein
MDGNTKRPTPERQRVQSAPAAMPPTRTQGTGGSNGYDPSTIHSWHFVSPDATPGRDACPEFCQYHGELKKNSTRGDNTTQ